MEINRQYIGARYVPKFYDGSNGTEWDSNHIYEPFTIVTYLNNSYTSKKTVPASVGDPMHNPEFWAATGNYNAQVEAYRQEVLGLEDMIKDTFATPEMYGAVGDGVADDTLALKNAFATGAVYLKGKYKVTENITLNSNIVLYGENAEIDFDADVDYPIEVNGADILINGVTFKKTSGDNTYLNRCIYVYDGSCVITNCKFYNFKTAIHCNEGYSLTVNNVDIFNTIGVDAQTGYGVDTSATYNHIENLRGINDSSSNGRHLIYLNGTRMKQTNISHVYCKNWYHNPFEIHVHDTDFKPIITINDVVFDNVNVRPIGDNVNTGAINCTTANTALVSLKGVIMLNHVSYGVTSMCATSGSKYEDIYIEGSSSELPDQIGVYIRNALDAEIKNIKINRTSQFIYPVSVRQCTKAIINNIYDFNDSLAYGINVRDSNAYIGDYISQAVTKINATGTYTLSAIERYSA